MGELTLEIAINTRVSIPKWIYFNLTEYEPSVRILFFHILWLTRSSGTFLLLKNKIDSRQQHNILWHLNNITIVRFKIIGIFLLLNIFQMGSLKFYSGSFGKPELLHLLRRTLFGVKKSDLLFFEGKSLNEVIDYLIDGPVALPPPPLRTYYNNVNPTLDTMDKVNINGNIQTIVNFGETWVDKPIQTNFLAGSSNARRQNLKNWWIGLQVNQDRQVYEKLIMFYQTLLVTEDAVLESPHMMYTTQSLYRKYAFGNYKELIKAISLDAGMLKYLNGEKNTKTAPDENYGRELQELFCVGKGPDSAYTENDVQEAARVLTGWYVIYKEKINSVDTFIVPKSAFNQGNHDTGIKQFSAFYGNKKIEPNLSIVDPSPFSDLNTKIAYDELEQMIDMIFETQEVSKYICRRLWNYFVYYDINATIEAEIIEPLSEIFRQNVDHPDQMKIVLKALFSSDLFFQNIHRACMIKSPDDFVVGMIRQLDFPLPGASQLEAQYYMWGVMRTHMFNEGQDINNPPNVAGWPAYYQTPSYHELWMDTSNYPIRIGTYEAFTKSNFVLDKNNTYDGANNPSYGFITKMNFVEFVKTFDNPADPNDLIEEATTLILAVPLSQGVKDALKTNYLLLGQLSDYYWTDVWTTYSTDQNTTDPSAKKVPIMLQDLFNYLMSSAEYHLS